MGQTTYEQIKDYFAKNGIPYREITHAPGASAEEYHQAVGCDYKQQAKCLLVRVKGGGEKGFVMVAVPANKRLDFEVLNQVLGTKKARMAQGQELEEVTGCTYGELPPLGKIFGIQLVMDEDLLQEQEVYMNVGLTTVSMVVDPKEIARVEQPHIMPRH